MSVSKLMAFKKQDFLNLETFRKNGQGVPTPVWFAEDEGKLYVRTANTSGKVKRIRNNGRVRIAPCDARGGLRGEWVEAQASLVTDAEQASYINRLLDRKYGFQKKAIELVNSLRKVEWIAIMIEVP